MEFTYFLRSQVREETSSHVKNEPQTHYKPRIVYPIRSFFTNGNGIIDSIHCNKSINIVGSCDGILCLSQQKNSSGKIFIPPSLSLWNPSTGKYNLLPYLDEPRLNLDDRFLDDYEPTKTVYGFGYDHLIDKYKVVAVSMYGKHYWAENAYRAQVKVHTSGTNSWRLIQNFPPVTFYNNHLQSGIFVSGTINWLVSNGDQPIISLDLGTKSYQPILYPDQVAASTLGVLKDCLCILARHGERQMVSDIWLMKEYGNRESWIKFASVPYMGWINNVLYVSEDDQVLLDIWDYTKSELVVYDPKNGNLKIQDIKNFYDLGLQDIYVESLISPCP